MGSKGNRYILIIDDPIIEDEIKEKIKESIVIHNSSNGKIPRKSIRDFLCEKQIEIIVK